MRNRTKTCFTYAEEEGNSIRMTGDIKVSLVAGICVLALAFISGYFLNVELDFISQYGPVWIYISYVITRNKKEKSKAYNRPLFWSLAMIIATALIVIVYGV